MKLLSHYFWVLVTLHSVKELLKVSSSFSWISEEGSRAQRVIADGVADMHYSRCTVKSAERYFGVCEDNFSTAKITDWSRFSTSHQSVHLGWGKVDWGEELERVDQQVGPGRGVGTAAEFTTKFYAPSWAWGPNAGLPSSALAQMRAQIQVDLLGLSKVDRVRQHLFPNHKETGSCFPGPIGYSGSHFSAAVALGAREA